MTQQPFYPQQPYPPQQPAQPQAYPPPAPQGYPPQAPYQAPPQQYPPQGYPQQGGYPPQAPQQPAVPLAEGSLDAFYSQPSVGGGPSISWSTKDGQQKPIGTIYVGVVAQDISATHVQQETDQRSGQPKFFKDGRPKFVMKVPMERVQSNFQSPVPEFPDGEGTWWCKGQGRDELTRAMAEAGVKGAPKKGAVIQLTLTNRKPSGAGMNPANVVQIAYTPAGTEERLEGQTVAQPGTAAPSPALQQPLPQAPAPQPMVPQVTYANPPTGYAQQAYQAAVPADAQGPAPTWAVQPDGSTVPTGQTGQVQQMQAPTPQPMAPQPPAGMTPEAAQILAGLGVQPQQQG